MLIWIMILLGLHVLAAVFWAGSTFAIARGVIQDAPQLFKAQMMAATVSVLAGGGLWGMLHHGVMGGMEKVLAIGAVCALAAAGVQGALRRSSPLLSQRIAAGLLVVTLLCMTLARYNPMG